MESSVSLHVSINDELLFRTSRSLRDSRRALQRRVAPCLLLYEGLENLGKVPVANLLQDVAEPLRPTNGRQAHPRGRIRVGIGKSLHLPPENLEPAVSTFPRWIIIANTAAAKRDPAFIHFSF